MTALQNKTELKQFAEKYQLSTEQAGKVLGVSRAQAFKMAKGAQEMPAPMKFSIELLEELGEEKSFKIIQKRLALS